MRHELHGCGPRVGSQPPNPMIERRSRRTRAVVRRQWALVGRAQLTATLTLLRAFLAGRPRELPTFVVLSRGRTGSTLLVDLLRCHPAIRCEGEVLSHRIFVTSPEILIRARARLFASRVYGFKIRPAHYGAQGIRHPKAFLAALQAEGWRLVHLRRRNVLRVALSSLRREQTKIVHRKVGDEPDESAPLDVPIDRLLTRMARVEHEMRTEEELLGALPHLRLTYEDDLLREGARQPALDRVFAFLGLPSVPVSTRYLRLSTDDLSAVIRNHDEVRQALAGTRSERFLDEP